MIEIYLNGFVAGTDCDKIFSRDLCRILVSPGMYYLNGKNVGNRSMQLAILYFYTFYTFYTKFLYFVSINFRESVIKLVAIRKAFANCKRKYLGKILKIGHGRKFAKNVKICKFCEIFYPEKVDPFRICSIFFSSC